MMTESKSDGDARRDHDGEKPTSLRARLFAEYRWLPLVLPFVVFMVCTHFEPKPPKTAVVSAADADVPERNDPARNPRRWRYPAAYFVKIVLVAAALVWVWPAFGQFTWRLSPLSVVVGLAGGALWIGICTMQPESRLAGAVGLTDLLGFGERAAFNPFATLGDNSVLLAGFLLVRFAGLVVLVPIVEEVFLRGFVMRFITSVEWWKLSVAEVSTSALVAGTVYGVLTHPGELLAAVVWFSLITWLMLRTRNIWDCVVAHAVTNLTLGVYIVISGAWWLW